MPQCALMPILLSFFHFSVLMTVLDSNTSVAVPFILQNQPDSSRYVFVYTCDTFPAILDSPTRCPKYLNLPNQFIPTASLAAWIISPGHCRFILKNCCSSQDFYSCCLATTSSVFSNFLG